MLGGALAEFAPIAGGDLSNVLAVTLADGRSAVAKTGPDPRAEAAMLRAITEAAVRRTAFRHLKQRS